MMLQCQSPRQFGHQSFTNSCKLHNPRSPFKPRNSRVLGCYTLLLKPHVPRICLCLFTPGVSSSQKLRPSGSRVFLGFKVSCFSQTLVSPPRSLNSINGKKKSYGGNLPTILRSLETEEDVGKALSPYARELGPKELTVVLKEQGRWERVVRVFGWMKSLENYAPNVIHYNVVLRALGLAQKWDELRLCWIEMARDGVMPTCNTYSMLISVYGRAGLVKESLLWIKHMRDRGISPDEVVMNTVVKTLKDAGEFDRADTFYKGWCVGKVELESLDLDSLSEDLSASGLSLKHFLSTELFKIGGRSNRSKAMVESGTECVSRKPQQASTYTTLIDLYGKSGRLDDAADVFAEMLKAGVAPNVITFNALIHTCGSHGHLAEAEALLDKMEHRGVSPDIRTYNTFISLYAEAGLIDAALRCYWKIREVGLRPNAVTYRAVLHMLCKKQMIEEVERVIREIEKMCPRFDEYAVPDIMQMYVNAGLLNQAKMFLEKCQLDGGFSSKTYAIIIDIYAEKELWTEAETVFYRNGSSLGAKKDVLEYNVMIKAYGKAKLYDKAFSLLKSMRNIGTWPDGCTYNSLIQMLAGADLVDRARDLLLEMQGAGLKPKCPTFSAVIAGYARLGRVSEAADVFEDMKKAEVEPNEVVYGSLINGFAEASETEKALQYYHEMEEKGAPANQIILTSLIKAYSKGGSLEGAKAIYDKLKKLEDGPDLIASNSMIKLYSNFGIVSEAKLIFDNLRQQGRADGVTYANIISLYNNMQMLDEAIDIAEEMKQSGLLTDSASFSKVMACYVSKGRLVDCAKLLNEMLTQNVALQSSTFKVLFILLKKGGLTSEAIDQLGTFYKRRKPYNQEAVLTYVFSVVELYDLALEYCDVFKNAGKMGPDTVMYNVAIYAYGSSGKINEALNLYMRMQDEGINPDVVTGLNLVHCYGKAHMVEGIKRIYSQLKYKEPSESMFRAVIDAYRNADRHDLAELVFQEMKFLEGREVVDSQDEYQPSGSEIEDESDVDSY